MYKVLAINTGSTSTKVAYYEDKECKFHKSVSHPDADIKACKTLIDQLPLREAVVRGFIEENKIEPKELSIVMTRGGLVPGLRPGGYRVTPRMEAELRSGNLQPHASNLAALIGLEFARPNNIPCCIYDAPTSADLSDIAEITGMAEILRGSVSHVLNSRAVAHKVAEEVFHQRYEDSRFVVAHLGGGISFSAHMFGRIVDTVADDAGAFGPERSGGLPLLEIVEMCYSGNYSHEEMRRKVRGEGGLKGLLGTSDCRKIEERIRKGDSFAERVYRAEAYQVAKGIGILGGAMKGQLDAIILTGGVAYSKMLTDWIEEYVSFIAPVIVYPGENEMEALAYGGLRILAGEEIARDY